MSKLKNHVCTDIIKQKIKDLCLAYDEIYGEHANPKFIGEAMFKFYLKRQKEIQIKYDCYIAW